MVDKCSYIVANREEAEANAKLDAIENELRDATAAIKEFRVDDADKCVKRAHALVIEISNPELFAKVQEKTKESEAARSTYLVESQKAEAFEKQSKELVAQ